MKLNKELLTKLSFFIGVIGIFLTGLLFSILGDLLLSAASYWMIGGILLTFGSGVCLVLSDLFREKRIVKWVLLGLAIALAIAFIGFMVGCQIDLLKVNQAKPAIRNAVVPVSITLIVLDAVSSLVIAGHVTLNALQKEE